MSCLPVLADATSRLHADIAIIRLLRAGIPEERISAVFSRSRAPNSVSCWLKNFSPIPRTSEFPAAAAGLLGRILKHGFDFSGIERQLEGLGLGHNAPKRIKEKIEEGKVVVCVHARTESEAATAWHVFRHAELDDIEIPSAETDLVEHSIPAMAAAARPSLAA